MFLKDREQRTEETNIKIYWIRKIYFQTFSPGSSNHLFLRLVGNGLRSGKNDTHEGKQHVYPFYLETR